MLIQEAINMLGACAKARKIEEQDQFEQWFAGEGLNDPSRFMPILSHALEAMVGEEGWLFDRLSVFAGEFGLAAAEEVCSGEGVLAEEVFTGIAGLVDKSLLIQNLDVALPRYRIR